MTREKPTKFFQADRYVSVIETILEPPTIDNANGPIPTMIQTNSTAIILDFKERDGNVTTFKTKNNTSFGPMPWAVSSFDFECMPNGELQVVEYDGTASIGPSNRSCSYRMTQVDDANG